MYLLRVGAPLWEQNERYRFFCLTMAVLIVLMITCTTYRLHWWTGCRGWAGRYKWIVWCSNNNENNSNKHLKRFASKWNLGAVGQEANWSPPPMCALICTLHLWHLEFFKVQMNTGWGVWGAWRQPGENWHNIKKEVKNPEAKIDRSLRELQPSPANVVHLSQNAPALTSWATGRRQLCSHRVGHIKAKHNHCEAKSLRSLSNTANVI